MNELIRLELSSTGVPVLLSLSVTSKIVVAILPNSILGIILTDSSARLLLLLLID